MPLVELTDGSTVMFLAPGSVGEFEAQGLVPEKVTKSLMQVTEQGGKVLLEAVNGVRTALSSVAPAELEIEVSLSLSKEGTVLICSAKAEGSLKIKATWKASGTSNA